MENTKSITLCLQVCCSPPHHCNRITITSLSKGPSLYCFKKDTDTEPKTIFYLTDWTVQAVEGNKVSDNIEMGKMEQLHFKVYLSHPIMLLSQHKHLIHLIRERPLTQVEELLANTAEDKVAWMAALMTEKNKVECSW